MKKQTFIAGLLTAAVLILIIASAGCVQQPPSGDVQPADTIDFSKLTTAVEIYAEDNGTEFNVGDTIGVVLPGNKEKGIAWKIKGDDDGLLLAQTAADEASGAHAEAAAHGLDQRLQGEVDADGGRRAGTEL